jgi:adenosylcobinamide-GDP ribazoletransferase
LPVPQQEYVAGQLGRAAAYFPWVGFMLGLLLWGTQTLLAYLFPPLLSAALTTALWAALTGGLHLDGVADCCDGLLAAAKPERRLEIMRDPRTGAFAVVGLVLILLLKSAAIAHLQASAALVLAPTWARWLLLLAARQPLARPNGLGAELANTLTPASLLYALVAPLLMLVFFFDLHGFVGVIAALLLTLGIIGAARRRLGGVTGDVYGLTVECSETVILLASASTVALASS